MKIKCVVVTFNYNEFIIHCRFFVLLITIWLRYTLLFFLVVSVFLTTLKAGTHRWSTSPKMAKGIQVHYCYWMFYLNSNQILKNDLIKLATFGDFSTEWHASEVGLPQGGDSTLILCFDSGGSLASH